RAREQRQQVYDVVRGVIVGRKALPAHCARYGATKELLEARDRLHLRIARRFHLIPRPLRRFGAPVRGTFPVEQGRARPEYRKARRTTRMKRFTFRSAARIGSWNRCLLLVSQALVLAAVVSLRHTTTAY